MYDLQNSLLQSLSLLDAVENLVASGTPESLTPLAAKLCQALFSYCAKRWAQLYKVNC